MKTFQRFEFIGGTSRKFWEVAVDGNLLVTHWGRLGHKGNITAKPFVSAAQAREAEEKIIEEKLEKGYRFIGRTRANPRERTHVRYPHMTAGEYGKPAAAAPARHLTTAQREAAQDKEDAQIERLRRKSSESWTYYAVFAAGFSVLAFAAYKGATS